MKKKMINLTLLRWKILLHEGLLKDWEGITDGENICKYVLFLIKNTIVWNKQRTLKINNKKMNNSVKKMGKIHEQKLHHKR